MVLQQIKKTILLLKNSVAEERIKEEGRKKLRKTRKRKNRTGKRKNKQNNIMKITNNK